MSASDAALFPGSPAGAARLRSRLDRPEVLLAPGCYDGMSARALAAAGHEAVFAGGFSMAAARLGLPDVGLMGFAESLDQVRSIRSATSLPLIADADTGYGNAVNVQRTLSAFARAGAECVMIEDQAWPKRCGHTSGKEIVDRAEAIARVRAAASVREELGLDVLIMARTDAVAVDGFDEAMRRVDAFAGAGADITFLEAPEDETQMATYCSQIPGHKTANLVEDGATPWLEPAALSEMGYSVVLYPVSMLLAAAAAQRAAAASLRHGRDDTERVRFDDVRSAVGWPDYERRSAEFAADEPDGRS